MKSPLALAEHLARQWQRADWRERHILQARSAWPLRLSIGAPSARQFRDDGPAIAQHLQAWRAIAQQGLGALQWSERRYQAGAAPVLLPLQWELARPSQLLAAIETLRPAGHAQLRADWSALQQLLAQTDARLHRLLLRRPALWRDTPTQQVVAAACLALQLAPGCAQGRPLRALAVAGNDSKFFERHASLLTALLDVLFDGEASRQGLGAFLGASAGDEHWLLLCPLAPGLLPFERQRVAASELRQRALPVQAGRILLVENERCLHLLPRPLAGTVAVLGAGLNLAWLCAPWLQQRRIAYWGDIDTWGLAMLARAREHLPALQPLLMDAATFERHAERAVAEPVTAPPPQGGLLPAPQQTLFEHLQGLARGRLEQEFLDGEWVRAAVEGWALGG
ncbi:DUF2220 family protein [Melaminivora jejuensis]|uniref:Wadjet anti-phage system protein JetD domain-containing protein n=1 Tax=Melaminivora jejuensis TaxID=1267217 RepID=UPI001ADF0113|nr:Wadjet anti-phage system protein JetD domain-containing protein [Melaminivora jejuensis]UHJ64887.1 DUF2220 family protein [Melaminivora jejuensis]